MFLFVPERSKGKEAVVAYESVRAGVLSMVL